MVGSEDGKHYLLNQKFLKPNPLPEPCEETAVEWFLPETGPKLRPILRRSERMCAKKKTVYFKK